MSRNSNICAVVSVKEAAHAKQRLAGVPSSAARQALACAMRDLFDRALRSTEIGLADELAAAASLIMGQGQANDPAQNTRFVPLGARAIHHRSAVTAKLLQIM
jgi:hypothetical protein